MTTPGSPTRGGSAGGGGPTSPSRGASGGGALLTKRQQQEKAMADYERKTRQLQTEVAEWKLKHRDAEKAREEEKRTRLKVEEQLSQSGAYLKSELAKAAAEQKKSEDSMRDKFNAERKDWEERSRRDDERRRLENETRIASEKLEREQLIKSKVREAEERAVREYEAQIGKAWIDQEEKMKESQEIIRKFRDDLVDKSTEQKRLVESSIIKDRQISALREQHEYDAKQLKLAKQTEINLIRHKSLVKYLSVYKYLKDHQLRKKVIGIHTSVMDLVGMLIHDQTGLFGNSAAHIKTDAYGDDGLSGGDPQSGGGGGGDQMAGDYRSAQNKQSEIDAWYQASKTLAKQFSANKLLIALSDATHVLAVTVKQVIDQLHHSRQEMESMLERVSDLTNIALAHEAEQERLLNKNRAERARYKELAEAYTSLDRSHHSLQKKMSQMVEYAQLHSGRTHSAGSGTAAAAAVSGIHSAHPSMSINSSITPDPNTGGGGGSSSLQMTSTTLRSPPNNPYLAASTQQSGYGRPQSPVRAGSAAASNRKANNGSQSARGSSAESQRSPHPPLSSGGKRSSAESTKQADEPVGGSAGSGALAAVSWLTPSKPKANKPAAGDPEPAEADSEDRAAAIRIAELKAWLSRAGKVKPKLWQASQYIPQHPSQLQQSTSALSNHPPVITSTTTRVPPIINTTSSSSQRPASAAAYSPRTYPTDSNGEMRVPNKLRITKIYGASSAAAHHPSGGWTSSS